MTHVPSTRSGPWWFGLTVTTLLAIAGFAANNFNQRLTQLEEHGSPQVRERLATVENELKAIRSTQGRMEQLLDANSIRLVTIMDMQREVQRSLLPPPPTTPRPAPSRMFDR